MTKGYSNVSQKMEAVGSSKTLLHVYQTNVSYTERL